MKYNPSRAFTMELFNLLTQDFSFWWVILSRNETRDCKRRACPWMIATWAGAKNNQAFCLRPFEVNSSHYCLFRPCPAPDCTQASMRETHYRSLCWGV
ncbi:Protein UPS2 [Fusarium oxysporum f. sp. albedinis]|nr:Protein UPS2 [Fusarium oxysporum f. sp. albedinis]